MTPVPPIILPYDLWLFFGAMLGEPLTAMALLE
jgi:hypothetical protein